MEEFKYVPNVNPEEKEVSKKDLEILSKRLSAFNDNLNQIRKDYNESLIHFPDDKNFLESLKTCGLAVTKEIEIIKMEIAQKVSSMSDYNSAN